VTLTQIGSSSVYETVFTSDGIVSSGTGEVAMFGGDEYNRVMVFGAGGVSVDRWSGSGWTHEGGTTTSQSNGGATQDGSTGTTGGTGDEYFYQTY
jgi:hypothetical protein